MLYNKVFLILSTHPLHPCCHSFHSGINYNHQIIVAIILNRLLCIRSVKKNTIFNGTFSYYSSNALSSLVVMCTWVADLCCFLSLWRTSLNKLTRQVYQWQSPSTEKTSISPSLMKESIASYRILGGHFISQDFMSHPLAWFSEASYGSLLCSSQLRVPPRFLSERFTSDTCSFNVTHVGIALSAFILVLWASWSVACCLTLICGKFCHCCCKDFFCSFLFSFSFWYPSYASVIPSVAVPQFLNICAIFLVFVLFAFQFWKWMPIIWELKRLLPWPCPPLSSPSNAFFISAMVFLSLTFLSDSFLGFPSLCSHHPSVLAYPCPLFPLEPSA